jgi:TolB-like protein/Tfp pilus assembly protein PilF
MANLVSFDHYEVDLAAGQIYRRGVRVRLAEQPFRVLASLLEHPGQLVTRDDLRRRLWSDEVFVDFDNVLNTAVARLREALGDSVEHPRFIETLPKRGYRFIAAVSPVASTEAVCPRRSRLLVLPFVNLSGDPAQEYFSDAMTDEITTELAGLAPDALALIARTTAMRYKGTHKDIARIGRELDVDYVVEGGVRRAPDRVALSVTLVRASSQMHVFARRYDVPLREMFDAQRAIARDIVEHIDTGPIAEAARTTLAVAMPEKTPSSQSRDAHDEYVQGRRHLARLTPEAFATARHHFKEAIAHDPESALAYDSLAEIYWYLGYLGFMSPRDAFSAGVLYAMRAMEIDNTLGETHAMLALYHKHVDYNWPEVDRAMVRARELSPTSPIVRTRYAFNALMPHGRLESAAEELERALEWDPSSAFVRGHLAIVLVLWRRWDEAMDQARMVLELEPRAYIAHLVTAVCYRERRMPDEAIAAQRLATELSGNSAAMLGWLGLILAVGGRSNEARTVLDRLRERARHAYVPPASLAWIHLGLGEIDDAFEWLDRAVEARDQLVMPLKSYAMLDPIRADPRFRMLLRKMHLDEAVAVLAPL